MADESSTIFNRRAAEKLRSPGELSKYVRVTNPSAWAVVGGLALLLTGLLAWGVFGTLSTSVTVAGTCVEGRAICFLSADDVAKVHVGDAARVGNSKMTVDAVASVPLSRDEARNALGSDYLVSALLSGDWAYQVTFEGDASGLAAGVPLTVDITTERVAPIMLLFR